MPTMTKRVNIRTTVAIRSITPPIHGTCNNIIMSTGDILKCLCKRAYIEEILPDGSTIQLNMKNYFTDNGAGLYIKKEENTFNHTIDNNSIEPAIVEEQKEVVEMIQSNNIEENVDDNTNMDEDVITENEEDSTLHEEEEATEEINETQFIENKDSLNKYPSSKKRRNNRRR